MALRLRAKKVNKFGAKKTPYNGAIYDSKAEAAEARKLDLRLATGEIKGWDRQFKVVMYAYDKDGNIALTKTHKIDFRVHELDGTYTLLETKGKATADWRDRVKWLLALWLPLNPNYQYVVNYVKSRARPRKRITK